MTFNSIESLGAYINQSLKDKICTTLTIYCNGDDEQDLVYKFLKKNKEYCGNVVKGSFNPQYDILDNIVKVCNVGKNIFPDGSESFISDSISLSEELKKQIYCSAKKIHSFSLFEEV